MSFSDLELFRALSEKDSSALTELYNAYGKIMYGLAWQILGNHQEAEDLIQEIFLSLWRNNSYNPERGTFKTFLMLLVRSRAIDKLRSRKTDQKVLDKSGQKLIKENGVNIPFENTVSDEIAQRVKIALAQLPEKQRQALEMSYFQGLNQQEISQQLNVSLGTVKSWFRLGFTKLRQSLQDLIN
jgi:RNA polymerase sigma-70 factor (ECF subfamily)